MQVDVTTYYLEMTAPEDLRPKRLDRDDLQVVQVVEPFPELNRFFYTAVGGDWYWLGRLPWTFEQWSKYLARTNVETWMLLVAGLPAGYFELDAAAGGDVEIVYFGILPRFIGQG